VSRTRLVALDDVPALTELVRANRDFLAPWEPDRSEEHFTAAGQRAAIAKALERYREGSVLPHVILGDSGQIAGRITLTGIVRGPLQSGDLGYWLSAAENGRGLVTAAVREMLGIAFGQLGLHRVQAGTMLANERSQRVLERAGFVRYGVAPSYLKIAGRWEDHILYQILSPDPA
jgi:[ribosomal protein S5]-alanine N-acetyltransferase